MDEDVLYVEIPERETLNERTETITAFVRLVNPRVHQWGVDQLKEAHPYVDLSRRMNVLRNATDYQWHRNVNRLCQCQVCSPETFQPPATTRDQPPLVVHRLTRSRSAPPYTRVIETRPPGNPPVTYRAVSTQTGTPPPPITDEYEGLDVTIADEDLINFESDSDRTQGNSCYQLYATAVINSIYSEEFLKCLAALQTLFSYL